MASEYVKFNSEEKIFCQRGFLQSQLEVIEMQKKFKMYQRLRTEEIVLKILLKSKVETALTNLYMLEKLLPKTTIRPKKTKQEENEIMREIDLTLEDEINLIRDKLEKLK